MSDSGSDEEWPFLVSGQLASAGATLYENTSHRFVACISAEGGGVPGLFRKDVQGSRGEGTGLDLGRPVLITSCFFRVIGGGGSAESRWPVQSRLRPWEVISKMQLGVKWSVALRSVRSVLYRGTDTFWGTGSVAMPMGDAWICASGGCGRLRPQSTCRRDAGYRCKYAGWGGASASLCASVHRSK